MLWCCFKFFEVPHVMDALWTSQHVKLFFFLFVTSVLVKPSLEIIEITELLNSNDIRIFNSVLVFWIASKWPAFSVILVTYNIFSNDCFLSSVSKTPQSNRMTKFVSKTCYKKQCLRLFSYWTTP